MNQPRCSFRKKPGNVRTHSVVVTTLRTGVVERCTSHPSTKNHTTPWSWKRRLW